MDPRSIPQGVDMYGNPTGTDYSGMERALTYSGMAGYPYGTPAVSLDAAAAAAAANQYCTTQDPFYLPGGYHYSLLPDIRQEPPSSPMMLGPNGKPKRRRIITFEQRKAANIRERRRMFNLNEAFDELRKTVPTFSYEKRLSRIETLRLAITYIDFMGEIVKGKDPEKIKLLRISGVEGPKTKKQLAAEHAQKAASQLREVKVESPEPEEAECTDIENQQGQVDNKTDEQVVSDIVVESDTSEK